MKYASQVNMFMSQKRKPLLQLDILAYIDTFYKWTPLFEQSPLMNINKAYIWHLYSQFTTVHKRPVQFVVQYNSLESSPAHCSQTR